MKDKLHTQIVKENPFQELYSWTSPERYWVRKTKGWYVTYSFFFIVITAFLALLGEYILIIAVLSFLLLWFIQGSSEPMDATHIVTSLGVKTFERLYSWKNVRGFWFSEKNNVIFLNLETFEDDKPDFIKRVTLLLNNNEKEVFNVLAKFTQYLDKKDISFNILMFFIHGEYIDPSIFMDNKSVKE